MHKIRSINSEHFKREFQSQILGSSMICHVNKLVGDCEGEILQDLFIAYINSQKKDH